MALFKKQKIEFEETKEKTPVRFKRKENKLKDPIKRKKIKRWVIISFLLILLGFGGYFGYKAYNSIKNIFANDSGLLNLLGGNQGQLLKGEIDGRVNILLLGVGDEDHQGSTLSDTMIVASYSTSDKAVSMISIPRDTYVEMPNDVYAKINSAHAYGEQKEKGLGPDWAIKVVEEYSGLPIHYFARVDFSGLEKIVDSLGGVTVNVENSFCDYSYPGRGYRNPVCFNKGEQQMDGEEALVYSRSRKALGVEGSDFARAKRQQNLLVAIKNKALSAETVFNPARVLAVLETLGEHIKTSFEISDLKRIYEISKEVDDSLIIRKNLDPTTGLVVADSGAAGYIIVPVDGIGEYEEIHNFFSGVFNSISIQKENAKLAVYNGTWNTWNYTKFYEKLEADGYNIVDDGGAEARTYIISKIIDYTNGAKPETIKRLEEELGVTVIKGVKEENQEFEIEIIVGKDYQG